MRWKMPREGGGSALNDTLRPDPKGETIRNCLFGPTSSGLGGLQNSPLSLVVAASPAGWHIGFTTVAVPSLYTRAQKSW